MKNIQKLISVITLFFLIGNIGIPIYAAEEEETQEKEKFVITQAMIDNWPYKHELTHTKIKMLHKPAWMYMVDNKAGCEDGDIYYILDDNGNKIKKNAMNCKVAFEDKKKTEIVVDEIFKDIETEEDESENNDLSSAEEDTSEENLDTETESIEEELPTEDEIEIDSFIEDLLGETSSNRLKTVKLNEKEVYLSGKQIHSSIKSFALNKNTIVFDDNKIKGLKGKDYYNGSIATLYMNFSKKVKINKYKNQFAKNLSDISFSISSYHNEELDEESRELFRKKLVNDMKKIQIGYVSMQKKEKKLYNFFFKRG